MTQQDHNIAGRNRTICTGQYFFARQPAFDFQRDLLREVLVEAKKTHRPVFAKPANTPVPAAPVTAQSSAPPRRPPTSIDKTSAQREAPTSLHGFSLGGNVNLPAPPPQ